MTKWPISPMVITGTIQATSGTSDAKLNESIVMRSKCIWSHAQLTESLNMRAY